MPGRCCWPLRMTTSIRGRGQVTGIRAELEVVAVKRYKVTGTQPVLDDKQPGETFDAVIPESEEAFLLQIGAIRVVSVDTAADKRIGKDKRAVPQTKAARAANESGVEGQESPPALPDDQRKDAE